MVLRDFFVKHNRVALAFSGGVDSAYLLYAGLVCGCDIHAYYVNSQFQPAFELEDACRLAEELHAKITIIDVDILSDDTIAANPVNRCYYCKKQIFSKIVKAAKNDGYEILIDGTNASDNASDRPGMQALKELSVYSPLRECGITKEQVRQLSREAHLFTWNKPAYACLATRIPAGSLITEDKLYCTEQAEKILTDMGFYNLRVRFVNEDAKIQIPENQFDKFFLKRREIITALKPYYHSITLDLEGRV